MESSLLKIVGQVAGIGGIGLGVMLLIFREIVRKKVFPQLNQRQAYRTLTLIIVLTFGAAAMGVAAWVFVSVTPVPVPTALPASIELEEVQNVRGDAIFSAPKEWDKHIPRMANMAIATHPANERVNCQSVTIFEGEYKQPFPTDLSSATNAVIGTVEKGSKVLERALTKVTIEQIDIDRSQGTEKKSKFYPFISAERVVIEDPDKDGKQYGRSIKVALAEDGKSYSWIACGAPYPEFNSLRNVFDQVLGTWKLTRTILIN